jgi:hypothetical protein
MVVGDSYIATRHLPKRADAKLQVIAGPGFLLDREQLTEIRSCISETRF